MVEFVCEKCKKVFNRKSNFQMHCNRKNPCVPDEVKSEFTKTYKTLEEKMDHMLEILSKKNEIIEEYGSKIHELEEKINTLVKVE